MWTPGPKTSRRAPSAGRSATAPARDGQPGHAEEEHACEEPPADVCAQLDFRTPSRTWQYTHTRCSTGKPLQTTQADRTTASNTRTRDVPHAPTRSADYTEPRHHLAWQRRNDTHLRRTK